MKQETFSQIMAGIKSREFAEKPIRTLGEVILLLESQPLKNIVKIDFTPQDPTRLISYRGYYEDLSISYGAEIGTMTVENLLSLCKNAIGQTYTGYKGGDFTMHNKTLMWVAPYGDTGRMLTDIKSDGDVTIIYAEED